MLIILVIKEVNYLTNPILTHLIQLIINNLHKIHYFTNWPIKQSFTSLLLLLFLQNTIISQNYFPIKINQKWGLMDENGKLVVEAEYEVIGEKQKFGYSLMQKEQKIGLLNLHGKIIIPPKYEEIKIVDSNFIAVTETGHQKIINANGKLVLNEAHDHLQILTTHLLGFSVDGLFGCVNSNGFIISKPIYKSIEVFDKKHLKIQIGSDFGLLDLSGNIILPASANDIQIDQNGIIFYQKGVLWGAYNAQGKEIIKASYTSYSTLNQTLIKLERFGRNWLFHIPKGQIISANPMDDYLAFSDKYVLTQQNNHFGLTDFEGNEILPTNYDEIQSFSANAFRVRSGWKWGIVNKNAQHSLNYEYDFIAPARNGKAIIKKNNFFGLIDTKGQIIVPAEYSRININGENIKAFKGEKWTLFYIDENGKVQKGGNFKKHFKIQIANKNQETRIGRFFNDAFTNQYLLDDFEWFFVTDIRKWGLRRLSDGTNEIEPIFDNIQIERDLGYTIVGIEKQGLYKFGRTNYRFQNLYGIVKNEVGKLVTKLEFWDIRSEDFRQGSKVARCVFSNGRHGLMLQNGKVIKRDFGYIGGFKEGLAKISISGKVSAQLNAPDKSLGKLPRYLSNLRTGSDMVDFTLHDRQFRLEADLTCDGCKWGFIDTLGDIIIQPNYQVAHDFINDVCVVKSKEKWGTIDRLGNALLSCKFDDLHFLQGTDNQVLKLSIRSQKYGLMDTLGQLLLDLKYDKIGQLQEGRLAVKKQNLWGFTNQKGQELIPIKFQKVAAFSEGLAAVKLKRKWIFIDLSGNIQLDNQYRAIGNFKQGKAYVKTDTGVGYISPNGKTLIPFKFSQAFDFKNGIARVVEGGKYGLIDSVGNYILKPKFSNISTFDKNGLAIVRYGNKVTRYGVIDQTGQRITSQDYHKIYPFQHGRALVKHKNGYGFIDKNGNLVIVGNYSKANGFVEGRAMVQRNNRCGFIDLAGNEIIPLSYSKCLDFKGGKAVVYEGIKKGGVIDLSGKEIIEPSINRLIDFKEGRGLVRKDNYKFYYISEDASWKDGYFEDAERYKHGIAAVQKNGKWGLINRNGLNLISPKYDKIDTFEKGYAKVHIQQFSGLSDLKGNLILPPEYEYITYAGNGLFRIEYGGKIGYLDRNGEWVWELRE